MNEDFKLTRNDNIMFNNKKTQRFQKHFQIITLYLARQL